MKKTEQELNREAAKFSRKAKKFKNLARISKNLEEKLSLLKDWRHYRDLASKTSKEAFLSYE